MTKHASKRIHSGFETQGRRHQMSKTGVSVTSPKDLMPSNFFFRKRLSNFYWRNNRSFVRCRQDSGCSTLVGRPLKIAALCGDQQDSEDTAGVPLYQHDVIVITAGTNLPLILSVHWVSLTASSVITSTRLRRADFSYVKAFLSLILMLKKFT